MPRFKIYAGLGGGCGGAVFREIEEFDTQEKAEEEAYRLACEDYESQQGAGISGWEDFMAEAEGYVDSEDMDDDEYQQAVEEYATQLESEERESWVDYYVEECEDGIEYDEFGDEIDD